MNRDQCTAVVLAGGLARRLGGIDKGLVPLAGRPMIEHVLERLRPQAGHLLINANRNLEVYRRYGLPVIADGTDDFRGPLAGLAAALEAARTPLLLSVPCDAPLLPEDLAPRLYRALETAHAQVSIVHDGERSQPVFALVRRDLLPELLAYLESGGRKVEDWYRRQRLVAVDFSDCRDAFCNVNTAQEQARVERLLEKSRPR